MFKSEISRVFIWEILMYSSSKYESFIIQQKATVKISTNMKVFGHQNHFRSVSPTSLDLPDLFMYHLLLRKRPIIILWFTIYFTKYFIFIYDAVYVSKMSNVLHLICHEQVFNKVVYAEGAIIALLL